MAFKGRIHVPLDINPEMFTLAKNASWKLEGDKDKASQQLVVKTEELVLKIIKTDNPVNTHLCK